MLNGQKIIVVMPAHNAARTLSQTVEEIPRDIVDEIQDSRFKIQDSRFKIQDPRFKLSITNLEFHAE